MQPLQDQRQTPALVKSSFTEAFLAVLRCTDAINPFEEVRGKERLHCFAQPVLTCQHAIKRFKHDMCNCCPAPAVLQRWVLLVSVTSLAEFCRIICLTCWSLFA